MREVGGVTMMCSTQPNLIFGQAWATLFAIWVRFWQKKLT